MLWHIELKFYIWLCLTVLQIKFECRQFASIFIRPSSDGTYYGMVMSVRVSVRPTLRPVYVRPGLCPPVVRTFLLHALTFWAEILHMTLFYCTTDQVWVSSLCVNFWRSYASLWTQNIGAVFSYMLWHIELKFCTWLCFDVLQSKFECCPFASIFEGVMSLLELINIWNTQFFAVFSCILWHTELKFCILLCFNVLQSKFECCHFASIFEGVIPLCEHRI